MKIRHIVRFALAVALMVVVGAGCSSPSPVSSGAEALRLTHIDVGVRPVIDDAPVFIALQHGLFRAQGLEVTPVVLNSGEAATQELLSGKLQFAFSNYVSTILTVSQGHQLRVVADGAQTLEAAGHRLLIALPLGTPQGVAARDVDARGAAHLARRRRSR